MPLGEGTTRKEWEKERRMKYYSKQSGRENQTERTHGCQRQQEKMKYRTR